MPLETATYVSDLVQNNPAGSDPLAKSADHIRLVKAVLKNTFGPLSGPLVSAWPARSPVMDPPSSSYQLLPPRRPWASTGPVPVSWLLPAAWSGRALSPSGAS
jgi:hypothetical protein